MAAKPDPMGKRFDQMTGSEKITFVVKLILFLATFGFAFPTILHSDEYIEKFH